KSAPAEEPIHELRPMMWKFPEVDTVTSFGECLDLIAVELRVNLAEEGARRRAVLEVGRRRPDLARDPDEELKGATCPQCKVWTRTMRCPRGHGPLEATAAVMAS